MPRLYWEGVPWHLLRSGINLGPPFRTCLPYRRVAILMSHDIWHSQMLDGRMLYAWYVLFLVLRCVSWGQMAGADADFSEGEEPGCGGTILLLIVSFCHSIIPSTQVRNVWWRIRRNRSILLAVTTLKQIWKKWASVYAVEGSKMSRMAFHIN